MKSRHLKHAAIAGLFLVAGCGPFSSDEILDGPYRLVAVDVDEDMSICWSIPNSGDCLGDGLPGPTVFAAGYNKSYLVAAVHPQKPAGIIDRSVTQYYYVIRCPDEAVKIPYSGIRGPFDQAAYDREKARLQLPEFTRIFENLR